MNPRKSRWQLKIGLALLAPAAVSVMLSSALKADDTPAIKGRSDVLQRHRSHLAEELPELPPAEFGGADVADHL